MSRKGTAYVDEAAAISWRGCILIPLLEKEEEEAGGEEESSEEEEKSVSEEDENPVEEADEIGSSADESSWMNHSEGGRGNSLAEGESKKADPAKQVEGGEEHFLGVLSLLYTLLVLE